MRYRAYFPPGYPHEVQAREVLDSITESSAHETDIVSFRVTGETDYWKLQSLRALGSTCPACGCEWQVWVPWRSGVAHIPPIASDFLLLPDPDTGLAGVDPGKCPACHPVAAELEPKERARLLVDLLGMARTAQLAALLEAHPDTIAPLVVACDAAQSSRAVAEYRSPRDIARIEELENALASVGLLG